MPRPKSDDPKQAITIRLRSSTLALVAESAARKARKPREHLEVMVERAFPPKSERQEKDGKKRESCA